LHEFFLYILLTLRPQILSLVKKKNNQMDKKELFFLLPFQNGFCSLQNSYTIHYLFKCILWTLLNIDVCKTYPWIFFEINCIAFFFINYLRSKLQLTQEFKWFKRTQKDIYSWIFFNNINNIILIVVISQSNIIMK
jgi:hypothetical protein